MNICTPRVKAKKLGLNWVCFSSQSPITAQKTHKIGFVSHKKGLICRTFSIDVEGSFVNWGLRLR